MTTIESRRQELKRRMRKANTLITANECELNRALNDWAAAAHEDALLAFLAQLMNCYRRLVQRTPVDTGRARAGWHIEGETDEWKPAPGVYESAKNEAASIIAAQTEKLQGLTKVDIIYVMNNVEHILALEAGWSRQSSGFVALFLTELRMQLERAAETWSREP